MSNNCTTMKNGLPKKVTFCKRCVMSNQRPCSTVEFKHTIRKQHQTIHINDDGVCDGCRAVDAKEKIDWHSREEELLKLLDTYRRGDGRFDCVVPGSGGKDSSFAAHILKYKYGMHPLTVTWPPLMYTDYGYQNFRNWLEVGGLNNISFNQNGTVAKLLTRLSFENLLHPFHTFALGQKNFPIRLALKYDIPLVFYGENEAEYGNSIADNRLSLRDKSYHTIQDINDTYLGGVSIRELQEQYNVELVDLLPYLPVHYDEFENTNIDVRYLGYYVKWVPQEAYYYAVEHTGFKARPFRTQGTYSKYNSIDDKIDDLHFYTLFIKFGIGRATYDASQEIRNKHITRKEGVALVRRYDGEFPDRYFPEIMDYLDMKPEKFFELCDQHRSPHLWKKVDSEWKLRHTVGKDGSDD